MKRKVMLVFLGLSALPLRVSAEAHALQGDLFIHDPSTIGKCEGTYWVFGTGRGIISRHSDDLVTWQAGPPVFEHTPAWTTNAVPGQTGRFWAPDVLQLNGRYFLYYSVSTWGSRVSAIGLATNRTLNPRSPDYRWEDCGPVFQTTTNDMFNAIDPSLLLDRDGRLWMAFGSFWSGIKLVELNPKTGLRLDTNSPIYSLAWNDSIEAACLYRHENDYFLFVNWGQCCRGTNSTYEIRVGRSTKATGPYLNKNGMNLMCGGGTLVLGSSGAYIGPGHAGILQEGDAHWFSYHYYNGQLRGRATLDILPLHWSRDGWPEIAARATTLDPAQPALRHTFPADSLTMFHGKTSE